MFLREWLRAPSHLLVAFLGVTLVPAAILGWLGWQLLEQDRALERQRVQERLEQAADRVAAALGHRLDELEDALPLLTRSPSSEALLVVFKANGVRVQPPGRLIYYPAVPTEPGPGKELYSEGEAAEFQQRDHAAAAAFFRKFARSEDSKIRAGALLRLGRNLRKLGRLPDALAVYGELALLTDVRIAGEPAALLARRARCDVLEAMERTQEAHVEAAALVEDLHRGLWRLDRATYEHHARALLEHNGEAGAGFTDSVALAAAVGTLWDDYGQVRQTGAVSRGRRGIWIESEPILLVWQGAPERMTGLAACSRFLETAWGDVWQALNLSITLTGAGGRQVLGPGPKMDGPAAVRPAGDTGLPWTLRVASADPASDLAASSGRRRLLLAGLAMICLLVAGGSYLIGRATARELAVARLQSDFVSAVSHEFRTPLTAMRHLTELLEGGVVVAEERRRRYYSLLSRETRRLHRLVEGLLNFGRMEAGRQQYRLEGLDLADFVEEVAEEFQRERAADGYSIEVSATANLRAKADCESLSIALWNLLDNAVKYSPECHTVWVRVRMQGSRAVIQVQDRGLGISPAERTAIFEKFVRGASSRTTGAKGTGIGLALVQHIVQAHGGEIQVESEPGQGSAFSILLELEGGTS
jgi:signal transduction histidine kinase